MSNTDDTISVSASDVDEGYTALESKRGFTFGVDETVWQWYN